MPTSSATSRTVNEDFHESQQELSRHGRRFFDIEGRPGLGFSPTDILPSLKCLNHS